MVLRHQRVARVAPVEGEQHVRGIGPGVAHGGRLHMRNALNVLGRIHGHRDAGSAVGGAQLLTAAEVIVDEQRRVADFKCFVVMLGGGLPDGRSRRPAGQAAAKVGEGDRCTGPRGAGMPMIEQAFELSAGGRADGPEGGARGSGTAGCVGFAKHLAGARFDGGACALKETCDAGACALPLGHPNACCHEESDAAFQPTINHDVSPCLGG